jgi:hypothetical protein
VTPSLARVQEAAAALDLARRDLDRAVEVARSDGASWATIGAALGVSRQAAWERFAGRRAGATRTPVLGP